MTDKVYDKADSPEKFERFSVERESELFIQNALKLGQQLAYQKFTSSDAAYEAGRQLIDTQVASAMEIKGIYNVHLKVSGSGVKVVNIDAGQDDEGKLIFDTHPGTPFVDLEPLAERHGRYEGFIITPMNFSDDTYGTMLYVVMMERQKHSVPINTQYGFPLSLLTIENRMLVACDGTAQIEVPSLAAYRSRNKAIADLALKSDRADQARLMQKVHRLNGALYREVPSEFTELRDVRSLRELGETGKTYAKADDEKSEAVVSVLRETLGHGRYLTVIGEASLGINSDLVFLHIQGSVVDILPTHPGLEESEPTIVLACGKAGSQDESLYYAPISRIESLRF